MADIFEEFREPDLGDDHISVNLNIYNLVVDNIKKIDVLRCCDSETTFSVHVNAFLSL